MWLVTEFRRGPSATSFFSLAPTLFHSDLFSSFFPPLCFFSACLILLRAQVSALSRLDSQSWEERRSGPQAVAVRLSYSGLPGLSCLPGLARLP